MARTWQRNLEPDRRWTGFWSTNPLNTAAIAFWISVAAFILDTSVDLGTWRVVVVPPGSAACGFAWLLSRALFRRDAGQEVWPLFVVATLIATGALVMLLPHGANAPSFFATSDSMLRNIHGLISSTVLLLALLEPCTGNFAELPKEEKRFRAAFILFYTSLLAISVVWLRSVPDDTWASRSSDQIKMISALSAATLGFFAVRRRQKYPLPKARRRARKQDHVTPHEAALAARIMHAIDDAQIHLETDLKLSALAKRLGETEHDTRRCITGALAFRNFNHMINHFRIKAAQSQLCCPKQRDKSILEIAFDCGFSSIGPFNRAFKLETGLTPSEYKLSKADLGKDPSR